MTDTGIDGIAHGKLVDLSDEMLLFAPAHTEYRLQLRPAVAARHLTGFVGKRIEGTIQARALRMFTASAGGKFIEPLFGDPRIIQGSVRAIDAANNRILFDAGVPMWLTPHAAQRAEEFQIGQMLNCYVESGSTFTPAPSM